MDTQMESLAVVNNSGVVADAFEEDDQTSEIGK